jgi:Arc/MetJ-type ribon-helix-helix transcriptional regulator
MKVVTINLPDAYINGLEKLVQDEILPNRSEGIRIAVRELLRRENIKYC